MLGVAGVPFIKYVFQGLVVTELAPEVHLGVDKIKASVIDHQTPVLVFDSRNKGDSIGILPFKWDAS